MSNEVEIVVTGKDNVSSSFGSANKAAKDYGKGLESTGEKADASEQKVLGLKDTVDGVATIMQGPGKQGIAAYLQGWADLASGVANFIIPAAQAATKITMTNLATARSAVTSKAAAVASKAWAVAQAVLNAVMSANPILLVVIAVAALVAGIIIAYKRSETFRAVVQKLWGAIQVGARMAAGAVLGMVDAMLGALSGLLRAMGHLPGPLGAPFRKAADAVDGARGKVRELQATINNTRGKNVSVTASTNAYQVGATVRAALSRIPTHKSVVVSVASRGVGAVQREIDSITGHAVGIVVGRRGTGPIANEHGGIIGAAGGGPRSSWTMVGEHGRELVNLPFGSRVRSNPDTERMMAGGGSGGAVVLEVRSGGSRLEDLITEIIRNTVRVRGGGNVQAAFGR